ncbi:MAG TPA: hypothetical protein VIW21_06815 [Chthoniobacterales bacterium]
MNSRIKIENRQSLRRSGARIPRQNLTNKWRELFGCRRRMHDPMLVFNMSIFNSPTGENRIFGRHNVHTFGT